MEGFGDVEAHIQVQESPYQDGFTPVDSTLKERAINLEIAIQSKDWQNISKLKRLLSSVFNPKLKGTFYYFNGERSFEITGYPEHVPSFPDGSSNQTSTFQRITIDILCPNPYWQDPNQTSKPLQAYVGNFTLPFTLPFELGVSGSRTTLYNTGDIPAPVRIDIQGPVSNPQITNKTNGQWLRVNRSIAADEILHIDTTQGQKRVEIYRGSHVYPAFGYLDHDSDWIQLEVGENEIEHIADAGDRKSLVAVTWNSMYVGV